MKSSVFFVSTALLALVLGGCTPSNEGNNAAPTTNEAAVNEAASNEAIIPSGSSTPSATALAASLPSVWVPGSDDKLHLKPVSKAAMDTQKKIGDPTAALGEIVRMAPKWFPPKTQVLDYNDDGKSVSINLSRAFEDNKFWSKAGEKTVELAVYALVNSASSASENKPVVLKVENRALSTLGEFDASDAIEPNPALQAKAGTDTGETGGA